MTNPKTAREPIYYGYSEWVGEALKRGLTVKPADTSNQAGRVKTVCHAYDDQGKCVGHLKICNGTYYWAFA